VRRSPWAKPHGITPSKTASYEKKVGVYTMRAMAAVRWPHKGLHVADAGPFGVRLYVYREADRGDLDNFVKAVLDGMSRAGVWANDKHVHYIEARMYVERERPRVEVFAWRLT
jgi:Holliday junction resolvase RusA-like endonuclease